MSLKTFSLLLLIALAASCTEFKKKLDKKITISVLAGSWLVYDISKGNQEDIVGDALLRKANDEKIVKEGLLLSFFKDGSFTEVDGTGNYQSGKWIDLGKDQIVFVRDMGITDTITVKPGTVNSRQSLRIQKNNGGVELRFVRTALPLKDDKEDPFYSANNSWRIKPQQYETPQQLQQRLANYFGHLTYILKSASERKQNIVSFQFSMGIVKIYSSGIGIQPKKIVPKTWVNTYFNNEEADSAYKMFGQYLQTSSYKGASVGDWIEDDYKILASIYGDAKQGKLLSPDR